LQGATGLSPSSSGVLKIKSFDSNNIVIRAYGPSDDVDSITATKDFSLSLTSKLAITAPSTVQILEVHVYFTASETVGRSQIAVYMPEPIGVTNVLQSFRPFAERWSQTSSLGGAASNSTMYNGPWTTDPTNPTGTIVVVMGSYTAAADQKLSMWV